MKYTNEELGDIIGELGITLDPELEIEHGLEQEEIIEQQKFLVNAIKMLLLMNYLDCSKFKQAIEIAKEL